MLKVVGFLFTLAQASLLERDRDLRVVMSTSSSRACNTSCISKNLIFCPNVDQDFGACCDTPDCPKELYCSNNAPIDATGLKLFLCPHEPEICGIQNEVVAPFNGRKMMKTAKNTRENQYSLGALCRYVVMFPLEANTDDQITLSIDSLPNSRLIATESAKFTNVQYREAEFTAASVPATFNVTYPNQLFVVIESTDAVSNFTISYQFNAYEIKQPEKIVITETVYQTDIICKFKN